MTNWYNLIQSIQSTLDENKNKASASEVTAIVTEVKKSGVITLNPKIDYVQTRWKIVQNVMSDLSSHPLFYCLLKWSQPDHSFRKFMATTLVQIVENHLQ
jgi:hypothetical protein